MGQTAASVSMGEATFDVVVCAKIRDCFAEILHTHPEVRGLACSIDWTGQMNETLNHGVWMSRDGVVSRPEGVIGGMLQTLRMLDAQWARAVALHQAMQEQLTVLATQAEQLSRKVVELSEKQKDVETGNATRPV